MAMATRWQLLQLFADGGDGGSGTGDAGSAAAESGVSAADAGRQRLRELGVPENRIRANRAYRVPQQQVQTATAPAAEAPEQAAAAQEPTPTEEPKRERMPWKEIVKDPEYSKEIQAMMQARVSKSRASEEALGKLSPALEMLAKKHGQDPGKIDYDALAKSILDDTALYRDKALELDVSDDIAKQLVQQENQIQRYQRQEQADKQQQQAAQHLAKLVQEAQALKQTFPGLDLRTEMQNDRFATMVSPQVGMSVEDAYYAIHRQEIQAAQAQVVAAQAAQQVSKSVQANAQRPVETGNAQGPSVTTFDYRKASAAERSALKQRILAAESRGEKVYPGR